jgi:hypothetical protein
MSSGETYYVVFTQGDGGWWECFLNRDIQHCYLVKPQAGKWMLVSKCVRDMDIRILDDFSVVTPNTLAIKVTAKECVRGLLMANTCVGHVKQVLGIRNPFILTPYQLYKYLRG